MHEVQIFFEQVIGKQRIVFCTIALLHLCGNCNIANTFVAVRDDAKCQDSLGSFHFGALTLIICNEPYEFGMLTSKDSCTIMNTVPKNAEECRRVPKSAEVIYWVYS